MTISAWRTFIFLIAMLMDASTASASAPSDSSIFDAAGAIRADVVVPPPGRPGISRNDLYFLGAAATGITFAMIHDEWLTDRAVQNQDNELRESAADVFNALPYAAVGSAALRWNSTTPR